VSSRPSALRRVGSSLWTACGLFLVASPVGFLLSLLPPFGWVQWGTLLWGDEASTLNALDQALWLFLLGWHVFIVPTTLTMAAARRLRPPLVRDLVGGSGYLVPPTLAMALSPLISAFGFRQAVQLALPIAVFLGYAFWVILRLIVRRFRHTVSSAPRG